MEMENRVTGLRGSVSAPGASKLLIFLVLLAFFFESEAAGQAGKTVAERILFKLEASAQLVKEGWVFDFEEDHCVFLKGRDYIEKSGDLVTKYRIRVPLSKVDIAMERKRYDSFFRCRNFEPCISRVWSEPDGGVKERQQVDTASLFIMNEEVAGVVYDLFRYLGTLCDRSGYAGPAGLKWGESIESATPKLSKRFTLKSNKVIRNGALFRQIYGDRFADFSTEAIQVNYVDGKFYNLTVIMKREPDGSNAGIWYDIVNAVIAKYGKPNQIRLPKAIKDLDEIGDRQTFKNFEVFDMEISEKSWDPLAVWQYENEVTITARVVPVLQQWEVRWIFNHSGLEKLAEQRIAENPVEDF